MLNKEILRLLKNDKKLALFIYLIIYRMDLLTTLNMTWRLYKAVRKSNGHGGGVLYYHLVCCIVAALKVKLASWSLNAYGLYVCTSEVKFCHFEF